MKIGVHIAMSQWDKSWVISKRWNSISITIQIYNSARKL